MKTINPEIIFSKGYNPKTVFLTEYKDIEGRLDPLFYSGAIFGFLDNVKFPLMTIAEISEYIKTGFAVGREAQADDDEEKYIQIRPTNIGDDGTLKFDKNVYIGSEYLESKKDQILSIGDVLFNNTNSQELVGKTSFFDVKGIFFSSNHITRIKTKEYLILPEYLCWILNYYQRNKVFFNICTNWNNQSGVGNELLRKIKIPIPPIEIQKKAIEKINTSSQKRSNAKAEYSAKLRSIDNHILETLGITLPEEDNSIESRIFKVEYKDVYQNRLEPAFFSKNIKNIHDSINLSNYSLIKIKDVAEFLSGFAFNSECYVEESNCILITIKNIRENSIDLSSCTFLPDDFYDSYPKFVIREGDLLIAMTGATIGKVGFYDLKSNALLNQRVGKIICKKINPIYLLHLLNLNIFQKLIISYSNGGAQPNISETDIMKISIPFPPIEKQNEIAELIKSIKMEAQEILNKSNVEIIKSLDEIETLLKS